MGIPSYYRTLISKLPHAIQRKAPADVGTLVVDMNCMIYHVLREPNMMAHVYPGSADLSLHRAWERKLHDEVCSYLTHIWKAAGAPTSVYVALDGVVPYAKIKQQRYRRFKSAAMKSTTEVQWDTNAITPGTGFMAAMGDALRKVGSTHGWTISDTSEPGEGEHKILQWLRSKKSEPERTTIVYGLDADLILLCLLAGGPIFLLREAMAFGKMIRLEGSKEVELGFFQVETLRTSLQRGKEWNKEQFYDYIFGMSFCGNDFLPTGLSLRIRDEGHAILLSGLDALWKSKKHLVSFSPDGHAIPNAEGLLAFARWIAGQEERLILTTIKRKMTARMGESDEDNLPLKEQAEQPLVYTHATHGTLLKPGWQTTYASLALGDSSVDHRKKRVADFWQGWCWILDYYQGLPVDLEWVYPSGYPPSWADLCEHFVLPTAVSPAESGVSIPLKPTEQLALVLPLSSWGLLLKTEFRNLPANVPQYWPQGFAVETFGKRFGWECEPMIPMLTPSRMRYEVTIMNRDQ